MCCSCIIFVCVQQQQHEEGKTTRFTTFAAPRSKHNTWKTVAGRQQQAWVYRCLCFFTPTVCACLSSRVCHPHVVKRCPPPCFLEYTNCADGKIVCQPVFRCFLRFVTLLFRYVVPARAEPVQIDLDIPGPEEVYKCADEVVLHLYKVKRGVPTDRLMIGGAPVATP